ncbi:DUF4234 domain-containing protein [Photobacterium leiognathi]|uniref:DUF4234 domain-containing protein n=1 Tax=Photobacterium leiognathi TaxID=553611 RepID=UPI0027397012|nr:DUF4234 domain-containing protein [Photobacterium leiognathi]
MNIKDLKNVTNIGTFKLLVLSLITGGIYLLMWLYRNHTKLNEILGEKIVSDKFIIGLGVALYLCGIATDTENPVTLIISIIAVICYCVMYIMWAFKMRKALQHYAVTQYHFKLKMNAFYTFIFTIYYINYCINDFETAYNEHLSFTNKNNDHIQPQQPVQRAQETVTETVIEEVVETK